MLDFVHLHVHSQYSILDGQASITKLVDKAMRDGMRGLALTDHGNMMGVKEFFNYTKKVKGKAKDALRKAQEKLQKLEDGTYVESDDKAKNGEEKSKEQLIEETQREIAKQQKIVDFKPIFGCEMYVARRGDKTLKDQRADQSGWHLIVLAKNEVGYHNLIKLVSRAWVDGFYMRPRTDHEDLERFSEGLVVCSACIGGEVPNKILNGKIEEAGNAILWF